MPFDLLFAGPAGPILIFFLRIIDVSMATVRTLMIMRGQKRLAPLIGFFESLVWVFAVGSAIQNLDSGWHVIGYAGGFAAGNAVGVWLEERMALGLATVRVVSKYVGVELADALRDQGHGVTEFAGQGRDGPVEVIYSVVQRRKVPEVLDSVQAWDPDAFVTVDEPSAIERGWLFTHRKK